MDKSKINILISAGFTANAATVYLAAVRAGRIRAGDLIKESGLPRSVVYLELGRLVERGLLVESLERGVSVYCATDPQALVEESERHTRTVRQVAEVLSREQAVHDREVVVFEGEDIVERVADKCLATPQTSRVYFLGSSKFGIQGKLERYWNQFHARRIELGIECRILYDISTDPGLLVERNLLHHCEARYMPINSELPMSYIFNNQIVGQILPAEVPPLALMIKSATSAAALTKYFDYLWGQSKPYRLL